MRRSRIRLALAVMVLGPIAVLAVEVQMARTGPRLDDEDGFRPVDLVVRPGPDALRVLWLGDSTATGVGAARIEESMAYRVAAGLTDGPVRLTIRARSGAQVHDVIDEQLDGLRRTGADVVLVSVGANDVTHLTRVPTFRERYGELVSTIRAGLRGATIILVGIPDIGTAPRLAVPLRQIAGWRADRLDDVIEAMARDRQLLHVDLAERTGPTFASDPDRWFSADEYHPNGAGHGLWAEAVLEAIDRSGTADSLGS